MQQHTHYYGLTIALGLLATVHERRGEWQAVLKLGEAMIEVSQAHSFHLNRTFGELHKGASLAMLGQPEAGMKWIRRAIAERDALNHQMANADYLAYTGLGYGLTGQVARGLALVNEAIHSLENSNDRQAEALIRQIKGELLLMRDLSGPRQL